MHISSLSQKFGMLNLIESSRVASANFKIQNSASKNGPFSRSLNYRTMYRLAAENFLHDFAVLKFIGL